MLNPYSVVNAIRHRCGRTSFLPARQVPLPLQILSTAPFALKENISIHPFTIHSNRVRGKTHNSELQIARENFVIWHRIRSVTTVALRTTALCHLLPISHNVAKSDFAFSFLHVQGWQFPFSNFFPCKAIFCIKKTHKQRKKNQFHLISLSLFFFLLTFAGFKKWQPWLSFAVLPQPVSAPHSGRNSDQATTADFQVGQDSGHLVYGVLSLLRCLKQVFLLNHRRNFNMQDQGQDAVPWSVS